MAHLLHGGLLVLSVFVLNVNSYSLGRQVLPSSDSVWSSGVKNYVTSLEPMGPMLVYKNGQDDLEYNNHNRKFSIMI